MSRRGLVFVGSMILSLALVGPVLADTTGGNDNLDIASAWDEDTGSWADLIRDNNTGQTMLYASFNTFEETTCTDDSAGYFTTSFSGSAVPTSFSFGRRQASAAATATIVGTFSTYDGCDGAETQTPDNRLVELVLQNNKLRTTTTSKTTTQNPDGTTTVSTFKRTELGATGMLSADGAEIAVQGLIANLVTTTRTH